MFVPTSHTIESVASSAPPSRVTHWFKLTAFVDLVEHVVKVDWLGVHEVTSVRIIFDSLAAKGPILEIYIDDGVAELVISSR